MDQYNFLCNICVILKKVQRKINTFRPTQFYTNFIQKVIKNEGFNPLNSRF